jgi:hypothetical protein
MAAKEVPLPKRTLSEVEKATFVSEKYNDELLHYKGHIITVLVRDQTDDNGKPSFVITRRKDTDFHSDLR